MRFRTPEIFLGAFLAVAIFAMGMLYASSVTPPNAKPESSAQNSAQQETAKSGTDERIADYTWWLAVLTGALVLTALGQGFFIARSDKTARISAEAAQDQIVLSRRALVQTQRAFVQMKHFEVFHMYDTTRSNVIFGWQFTPIWENSGQTPTKGLNIISGIHPGEFPDNFEFKIDKLVPGLLGPKGGMTGNSYQISLKEIFEIKAGTKTIYIWGRAEYNDVFPGTGRHYSNFCHKIVVAGDPTIVESGIRMIAADIGNYTDDDSEE